MSSFHNICFVVQVTIDSVVYYYCSYDKTSSILLDGNTYQPYIISIGDAEKIANFGEGNQIGKCSISLLFGKIQYQNSYNIDITLPWNNSTCQIKIYHEDNDSDWDDCDSYYKGIIKNFKIGEGNVVFDIEDINHKDNIILPTSTVEDVVNSIGYLDLDDIPEKSVGKYIPIQYGSLTNTDNGLFAKGILISKKIGFQEIYFDTEQLCEFSLSSTSGIGVWEDSLNRFFVGKSTDEYEVVSNKNIIKFTVDTTTTLHPSFSMGATTGQEEIQIQNGNLITFDRESASNFYTETAELLGSNIIAIDNELMLLLDEPNVFSSPHTVWIERGFNGTDEVVHSSGSSIYQSAKYSARNLLSFTELFLAKVVANQYFSAVSNAAKVYTTTPNNYIFSNIGKLVDDDANTFFGYYQYSGTDSESQLNFDIRFNKIEGDYTLTGAYLAIKLYHKNASTNFETISDYSKFELRLFDTHQDINYNNVSDHTPSTGNASRMILIVTTVNNPTHQRSINTVTSINRSIESSGSAYQFYPVLNQWGFNEITNLKDLNRKWKVNLSCELYQANKAKNLYSNIYIYIYQIGFWADFFIDFTARPIMGTLRGRLVNATIDAILNTSDVGTIAEHPIQALLDILLNEMEYSSSDFDTSSWRAVWTYMENLLNEYIIYDQQLIYMSYGIDEHEKGWLLCQKIASQFCMSLTKTDNGKIKLISLFQLQDTSDYGYNSLTSYKISFDNIIMSGTNKKISIQQTGTDRIRNIIRINYNRNNSTNKYQAVYPKVQSDLDSYQLIESGLALSNARDVYYNGQKTEPLEIDAFSISNDADAERLCKWHLNDKAEVHFFIICSLPYYHYSDKNNKSEQYDIGDIVYFDGLYQGITFNSTNKFIISKVQKTNQGREVIISAKSIQPISEF